MKAIQLLAIALLLQLSARAQNAGDIISKHIKAIGGTENWHNIKTMKRTGTINSAGTIIQFTETQINNKAMRMDVDVKGFTGYTIITNTHGWGLMPGVANPDTIGSAEVKASQEKLNIADGMIASKNALIDPKYIGKDSVNKISCYKITGTNKDHAEITAYFSTDNYYLLRLEITTTDGPEHHAGIVNYSDFKTLPEGIVIPMVLTTSGGGIVTSTIEVNKPVDENIFKPSESK